MYKRILLAYDGSVEGRTALREGALLAKHCGSEVHLLSVLAETPGLRMAEGAYAGCYSQEQDAYQSILQGGVAKLRQMGLTPVAQLIAGEPARVIGDYARKVKADLVVVGHRRQGLIERWWSGSTGAYLVDHVDCSLLIARCVVSDEVFQSKLEAAEAGG